MTGATREQGIPSYVTNGLDRKPSGPPSAAVTARPPEGERSVARSTYKFVSNPDAGKISFIQPILRAEVHQPEKSDFLTTFGLLLGGSTPTGRVVRKPSLSAWVFLDRLDRAALHEEFSQTHPGEKTGVYLPSLTLGFLTAESNRVDELIRRGPLHDDFELSTQWMQEPQPNDDPSVLAKAALQHGSILLRADAIARFLKFSRSTKSLFGQGSGRLLVAARELQIAAAYARTRRVDKAWVYGVHALSTLDGGDGDYWAAGVARSQVAAIGLAGGRSEQALQFSEEALKIFELKPDEWAASAARLQHVSALLSLGHLEQASDVCKAALATFQMLNDKRAEAVAQLQCSDVSRRLGILSDSIHHSKEALSIFTDLDDDRLRQVAMRQLAELNSLVGESHEAKLWSSRADDLDAAIIRNFDFQRFPIVLPGMPLLNQQFTIVNPPAFKNIDSAIHMHVPRDQDATDIRIDLERNKKEPSDGIEIETSHHPRD